jgi:tRNA(Met) C34 N-acetyltransferase TmcA
MNIDEKLSIANGKNPASIINLTNDQRKAYNELIKFIDSPYNENDYKRALIGAAGVGKTYLIKALLKNCNLSYSTIGLSAPSHKACRVLRDNIIGIPCSVNTVQSDFGLRLNFDIDKFDINNPPFDPKGHVKVDSYYLYIIDEASMINRDLLRFIEKYLKKAKCKIIYCGK